MKDCVTGKQMEKAIKKSKVKDDEKDKKVMKKHVKKMHGKNSY